jgi:hypothetical protein
MTSHYRHRRISNPATAFPALVEPGEITVNSANRQLAIGDADPGSPGVTKVLLAVRVFDAKAQYAANDFVVQAGALYRAKVPVMPGAFNASQWSLYADQVYIDAADAQIITNYQAADTALQTAINGKVAKGGDTMNGLLVLSGPPTADLHAATKKYVDTLVSQGGVVSLPANAVTYTPGGTISSVNVQTAITELASEKAEVISPVFGGDPRAPTPTAGDNDTSIATTAFVQGAVSAGLGTIDLTPYAPKNSPTFTGDPQAPTPSTGDNDTSIATTQFVASAITAAAASAAEYVSNSAPNKTLTPGAIWGAAQSVTLTDAASVAPDLSKGSDFLWTAGAAGRTLANAVNGKPGQKGLITINSSGNVSGWGGGYKFPNATKPTMTGTTIISYVVGSDSVTIFCTAAANFG